MRTISNDAIAIARSLTRPEFIMIYPAFLDITGNLRDAFVLSRAVHLSGSKENSTDDGWFYKTLSEWETETHLSHGAVYRSLESLKKSGFISSEMRKRNGHAITYYRINDAVYDALITGKRPAESMTEEDDIPKSILDFPKMVESKNGLDVVQKWTGSSPKMDCARNIYIQRDYKETDKETSSPLPPEGASRGGGSFSSGTQGSSPRGSAGSEASPPPTPKPPSPAEVARAIRGALPASKVRPTMGALKATLTEVDLPPVEIGLLADVLREKFSDIEWSEIRQPKPYVLGTVGKQSFWNDAAEKAVNIALIEAESQNSAEVISRESVDATIKPTREPLSLPEDVQRWNSLVDEGLRVQRWNGSSPVRELLKSINDYEFSEQLPELAEVCNRHYRAKTGAVVSFAGLFKEKNGRPKWVRLLEGDDYDWMFDRAANEAETTKEPFRPMM